LRCALRLFAYGSWGEAKPTIFRGLCCPPSFKADLRLLIFPSNFSPSITFRMNLSLMGFKLNQALIALSNQALIIGSDASVFSSHSPIKTQSF